ncbi:MAG: tRNA pseudouridine(55) synthase TruB [Anaerovoracaceae bacterium]|jgi:tRNA pseudouridine55 synthase
MSRTDGIINMLKPPGMTSHDAVAFLRRISGVKKVGHTGTLDPMATGVLPLCMGNGTRVIEYMDGHLKEYRCQVLFGVETDTLDVWGKVLRDDRSEIKLPDHDRLIHALTSFEGDRLQVPPQFSAIKIRGRPLYSYARRGQEVYVEPRRITIKKCRLVSYDKVEGRAMFDVLCSPGTYMRSLCQELGEVLGTGGTMSFLLRMGSGPFHIKDAKTVEDLEKEWGKCLLPVDYGLMNLGILRIPSERKKWFCNGGYLRAFEVKIILEPKLNDKYRVYCHDDFLGTADYSKEKKIYLADKVFNK